MNSTTEHDAVMNIFQNNITGLYNVSISLSLSISPDKNVSIFCVLQPEPAQTQLLSLPYIIGKVVYQGYFFYQVLYTDGYGKSSNVPYLPGNLQLSHFILSRLLLHLSVAGSLGL